jgi:hypothetical protein
VLAAQATHLYLQCTTYLAAFIRTIRKLDLRGDVSGDNRLERAVQIGTYLVATGPGHQGGTKYTYLQFPVTSEADVRGARLEDLTGDGKAELQVELVQHLPPGARIIWQLLS